MKHATIIPLIGGEAIGVEKATGSPPEYILSYTAFASNDSHLVNYYAQRNLDVPYHNLDEGPNPHSHVKIDSVSSVCPCAGLSALSTQSHADNPANDWMYRTAEYVLSEMRPAVYWGENAPALYTNKGKKVREGLIEIGRKYGYTMSFYKTKSLLHGIPQIRNRSFFFFWKGDQAPVFNFYNREMEKIEDLMIRAKGNSQTDPINKKTPSDDPFYAYILKKINGGMSHRDFVKKFQAGGKTMSVRSNDVLSMIEDAGEDFPEVRDWLRANGYERGAEVIEYEIHKKSIGKGTMRRNTIIPSGHIGAFVGHYPYMLAHPVEDRYVNYREAMTIMGLPDDFELLDPKRNVNHICQNVPVQTAADMATEVQAVLDNAREWRTGIVMQDNSTNRLDDAAAVNAPVETGSLSAFF